MSFLKRLFESGFEAPPRESASDVVEELAALQAEAKKVVPGESPADRLRRILSASELDEKTKTAALKLARPAARMVPAKSANVKTCLGGDPSLPPDIEWPLHEERPMACVAQLALEELPAAIRKQLHLPASGVFSFFISQDAIASMDANQSIDDARLIFNPKPGAPTPRLPEHPADLVWPATPMTFVEDLRLPSAGTGEWDELLEDPFEVIPDVVSATAPESNDNLVGGWANEIQDVVCASGEVLLLQLDSNQELGWSWGDEGRLYFHIEEDALKTSEYEVAAITIESR